MACCSGRCSFPASARLQWLTITVPSPVGVPMPNVQPFMVTVKQKFAALASVA